MKIVLALSVITLLGFTGAQAAVYTLSGTMDVSQAGTNGGFGGGTGNGSGTIAGLYDDVSNQLDYTITFSNLQGTVTNMHFHLGAPGVSGGVELGIPGPWSSPQVATGVSISEASETNLLAGNWYVNVHTSSFGGGEIRGQVEVSPIPEPTAPLMLLGAMAGFGLLRKRRS